MNLFRHWCRVGVLLWGTVVAAAQASPYADAIKADHPFAYYRLDEPTHTSPATDEEGGNSGAYKAEPEVGIAGAILSDRKSTGVMFSRAQQQFVQLTMLGDFGVRMTKGFTVEFWLKVSDPQTYQVVMGTANGPDFLTDFLVDIGYGDKPGRLRLYYRDEKFRRYEANFYSEAGNAKIFDDAWHLITQVYDPEEKEADDRVQFFVDGVRQAITVYEKNGQPVSANFNQALTLGAVNERGIIKGYLEGCLDEVAFYLRPLSARQILNHYRAAFP